MPISSLTAARIVCERSDWQISNLKLQKILYLAHMAYIGRNEGKPLIDGHFEAWDYGPVLPDVYEIVARFGRDPIKDAFGPVGETDEKEKKALEFFSDTLLQFSAAELVGITHWEHGAWAKNYAPGEENVVISLEDIFDEYRDRKKYIKKEESAVIRKRIIKYACKATIFILSGPISFFLLCRLLAIKKSS